MNKGNVMLALLFLVILIIALFMAFPFPKEAKILPLVVLVPGALMALANFINELKATKKPAEMSLADTSTSNRHKMYQFFLSLLSVPLLSWFFGATLGFPLFLLGYLKLISRETWFAALLSAFLCWVVLYVGFDVVAKANFDEGFIFDLMKGGL